MTQKEPKVVYKVVEKPDQLAINAVFDYLFDSFIKQEQLRMLKNENT